MHQSTFKEAVIAYLQVMLEMNGSGYASEEANRIYRELKIHPYGLYVALAEIATTPTLEKAQAENLQMKTALYQISNIEPWPSTVEGFERICNEAARVLRNVEGAS